MRIVIIGDGEVGFHVAKALEGGLRKQAGITAPPQGLYSLSVIYPQDMIKWPPEVLDK